jgi:uncharacterized protein HemY
VRRAGSLCICPISRSLGLLAAAMERWDDADRHFDDALARATAAGAAKLAARVTAERRPSDQEELARASRSQAGGEAP